MVLVVETVGEGILSARKVFFKNYYIIKKKERGAEASKTRTLGQKNKQKSLGTPRAPPDHPSHLHCPFDTSSTTYSSFRF